MNDVTSHIGFLQVDLLIPEAQSLKDKRHHIKSIKDRTRAQFNVSVAELGDLDKWQTATLGFTAVGNDNRYIDGLLQNIVTLIESYGELRITDYRVEFL